MTVKLQAPQQMQGDIMLPASKSITARALLIAALCGETRPEVYNAAVCDDTTALRLGLSSNGGQVNVGPAGTAMRFLTVWFATREGMDTTLDGDERMRQRPIAHLVNALRQLGADISYAGMEGYPPLHIVGKRLTGGHITMDGGVSSQFISAVMMMLPVIGGGDIKLTGDIVSRPYIDMTAAVMTAMGAKVNAGNDLIVVEKTSYKPTDYLVEADWSAAAPWYALTTLLPHSSLTLQGLSDDSIQGDAQLSLLMRQLGVDSRSHTNGVTIHSGSPASCCCCSAFMDMAATPDLIPSMVVLLCLLERSFRITGARTLRHKESDRLAALQAGLAQLGYALHIEADGDAVSWYGERVHIPNAQPPVIDSYHDHRMALAFAPAAVRYPGISINHAECVSKSYPDFWQHLEKTGFHIVNDTD